MGSTYTKSFGVKVQTNERLSTIKTIKDLRAGNSFDYFVNKFARITEMGGVEPIDREALKKSFVSLNFMDKVLKLFVSFCPTLTYAEPSGDKRTVDKKIKLFKKALQELKWSSINEEIYETFEMCGDSFYHIYFEDKDSKIPKLKFLKPENLDDILVDDYNNPKMYIYRYNDKTFTFNTESCEIEESDEYEVTLVFEKGKTSRIVDGKVEDIPHRPSYKDDFSIIHIPSYKSQDEKFSKIPASEYIDNCLFLDQIYTDIRGANRNQGFPIWVVTDGEFVAGDKRIGGILKVQTDKDEGSSSIYQQTPKQAKLQSMQINNELRSMNTEKEDFIDDLYDKVGLTSPSMMRQVGKSDSSKVLQQVNNRMEKKIERYIGNIIEAFGLYFKILLKENGLYEESKDLGISFKKPDHILKNSPYDQALYEQLLIQTGTKSIRSVLRDKGMTEEDIDKAVDEINEEVMSKANDVRVDKSVKRVVTNANNIEE